MEERLPIHHPPNINFGFLKHKILNIKKEENENNDKNDRKGQ